MRQSTTVPIAARMTAGNDHRIPRPGLISDPARPSGKNVVQCSDSYPVTNGEPYRAQSTTSVIATPAANPADTMARRRMSVLDQVRGLAHGTQRTSSAMNSNVPSTGRVSTA